MKKLLKQIPAVFIYFCVATVLGQAVIAGVLMMKRPIDKEKANRIFAVFYDVKDYPFAAKRTMAEKLDAESPSLDDISDQRTIAELEMTLKENAIDKGLTDMLFLRQRLGKDVDLFRAIKGQFDEEIKQKEKADINEGVRRLQRNIAAMPAKQAKDTLLQMIEKQGIPDVVAVLSHMPPDKKRKIVSEFKGPGEGEILQDILREMLVGDVATIENSQKQMNAQFGSKRRK